MNRPLLVGLALALTVSWAGIAVADSVPEPPEYLRLLEHADLAVDPDWRFDRRLQQCLDQTVSRLGLGDLVRREEIGFALVDVSDGRARLAEVNGGHMMYAASVPKVAVLFASFQAAHEGRLELDGTVLADLAAMIRHSDNAAASRAIQRLGFDYIASVLWQSDLYDPEMGGGLWVGKAYGGNNDRWHRDPLANVSHGATPLALARLLTVIAQDRLVDANSSREMKKILGDPAIHHKFVRGLDSRPGSRLYRKSGTWRDWHGDAALVERDGKRYVATALCHDENGEQLLQKLIVALDDCVPEVPSVKTSRR